VSRYDIQLRERSGGNKVWEIFDSEWVLFDTVITPEDAIIGAEGILEISLNRLRKMGELTCAKCPRWTEYEVKDFAVVSLMQSEQSLFLGHCDFWLNEDKVYVAKNRRYKECIFEEVHENGKDYIFREGV